MKNSDQKVVTVRDAVYEVMRSFGADKIFGNPGSTELPMFRDFPDDFQYVLGLQEAVVVGMADGYAQATGKVAFVNLHSAAGVGNGMGNIPTAFKNRTPMVIIAGQQARSILPFDPYLYSEESTELPKPYVKWSTEPARAEDVPMAVAIACRRALQAPCGPVLVSVPSDDWDRAATLVAPRVCTGRVSPEPQLLKDLAHQLAQSQRPAIVVGAEVDRSGAWDEIVALAERYQARVFVAPMSARCSFPEDHPLFMGFLPAVREKIVELLDGSDVVLIAGAPVFTYHVEGDGPHVSPSTQLYQLTEDAISAARAPIGTSVVGDIRLALQALLAITLPQVSRQPVAGRRRAPRADATRPLNVPYVLQTFAEIRAPDAIIVEETPTARVVMHDFFPVSRPASFYTMASGGLGYGIAAAVGVAMAQTRRKIIAIIGDGSAMYSIQALWTAAQLGLNITFIILNNRRYAAMVRFGGVLGFPVDANLPGTDIPGLDFVAIAQGHGCPGARVEDSAELSSAMSTALATEGPVLIEIVVA